MDELAQQDHTYRLSRHEFKIYWNLTLNKSGKNGPMRLRSDFRAAVSPKNRLHRGGTGTRPKAGGAHEFNSFFQNCLLQVVSLTVDGDPL